MNAAIYEMSQQSECSRYHRYNKKVPNNGGKHRRFNQYRLKVSNKERLKQTKVNYDTWRRAEINNAEDDKLDNLHYANFLGDKYGDHGASYNKSIVNLKFCDRMCEEKEELDACDSLDDASTLASEISFEKDEEFYD